MTTAMERAALTRQSSLCALRALLPLSPLFAALVTAILLWSCSLDQTPAAPPSPEAPPRPAPLVTAEQLSAMSYTDSVLGELTWTISDESLEDLNRVLREYKILTAEEISQFLAQAAVETAGGRWLLELGDEAYFQHHGYTSGTRGAGFFHLTFAYGQMAFATWMMKRRIPEMAEIPYINPTCHGRDTIAEGYYSALALAANLGLDVSAYSRIVYDGQSPVVTGAEYIAQEFAWESAGYYWHITGISAAMPAENGTDNTDAVSKLVGGGNWQSRREAYLAFYPVLHEQS